MSNCAFRLSSGIPTHVHYFELNCLRTLLKSDTGTYFFFPFFFGLAELVSSVSPLSHHTKRRFISTNAKMSPKDSDELLDEEYLLEEEQKDDLFAFSSASKRNGLWARLLPYSAALNVILLLSVVVAVWIVPIQRSRGTCIPNEVYCSYSFI